MQTDSHTNKSQHTPPKKWQQQLAENGLFYFLLCSIAGLLAFLSVQFNHQFDLTFSQSNTLSPATHSLLSRFDKSISITVYATEEEGLRQPIHNLLKRYQHIKNDIDILFIDPEREPFLVREKKITSDGETIIEYNQRQERILRHNETSYSNALQRLLRGEQRWLLFTKGHGEREPHRGANHDVSDWMKIATERGFKAQAHNLTTLTTIPDNISVLVIASPTQDFLAGEVAIIENYIDRGGNLLWLVDPGRLAQLDSIATKLHIKFDPGTIVDPTGKAVSIQDPRFSVVTEYPPHPINNDFSVLTLFPIARALSFDESSHDGAQPNSDWQRSPLLYSHQRSWAERGKLNGSIRYDKDSDLQGPLLLGLTLSREIPVNGAATKIRDNVTSAVGSRQQKIVVIGDGDFLSNTYSGNGGNIELGLNILNWLSNDEQLLQIPVIAAPDKHLNLSTTTQAIIAIVFFGLIPLCFASWATFIWFKRRKL